MKDHHAAAGEPDRNSEPVETPARLPYAAPQLKRYGDLAALTRRVGTKGSLRDKTGNGMNKTR